MALEQPLLVHTSLMICPQTYVPNPPCQLSLWEETGVPGENPRLSTERWLFTLFTRGLGSSHIEKFSLRLEPATLEVKGKCANHFATTCLVLPCIPVQRFSCPHIHREKFKRIFFCMLRNTRSKLMRIIYHLRLWLNSKFLFFDTFLNRRTNLKSMFSALSVK
jgi:hypothetical protein